jgi:ferredoxin
MDSAQAGKLVFNEQAIMNLAVYLSKHEVKKFGKIGIIASLPVMKTLVVLSVEHQIAEDQIVVIGVTKSGELIDFSTFAEIEAYINANPVEYSAEDKALLEKIEAMPMEERWSFWQEQFSKCFKCYACRSSCPMCYCTRCTVDNNQPQWIHVPSHEIGNFEWHLMRAMHLAGRCVSCNNCSNSCPENIPLNLLTMKTEEEIIKSFGFRAGHSLNELYALSDFKVEDKEQFIR